MPREFGTYHEPFVGGGALFFAAQPASAVLSDKNYDLISTYGALKNNWRSVRDYLTEHSEKHSKAHYYKTRAETFRGANKRAAQFIYLNRVCWNGLYRVNLKGKFNVPLGSKTSVILSDDNFEEISRRLQAAQLRAGDFEEAINSAKKGDFVFVDPPYTVKHNNNGFIKYNDEIFDWNDQIRLSKSIMRASKRGVRILMTNANHSAIFELYAALPVHATASRRSVLAGDAQYRSEVSEAILRNYEDDRSATTTKPILGAALAAKRRQVPVRRISNGAYHRAGPNG